jgi:serine/threonine protein kinase
MVDNCEMTDAVNGLLSLTCPFVRYAEQEASLLSSVRTPVCVSERATKKGDVVGGVSTLLAVLGRGSYGTVWLARHVERPGDVPVTVAVKCFDGEPDLESDDEIDTLPLDYAEAACAPVHEFDANTTCSAKREVVAYTALQKHPDVAQFVVPLLGHGLGYLTCEYVQSPTITQLAAESGPQSFSRGRDVGRQLRKAVAFVHSQGFTHCDLSADNVFVRSDNTVRLFDFGLARQSVLQKRTDYIVCRWYRPPEVMFCLPQGQPVDVWCAATVILQLFHGACVFPGKNSTDQLLHYLRVLGPVPASVLRRLTPRIANRLIIFNHYPNVCDYSAEKLTRTLGGWRHHSTMETAAFIHFVDAIRGMLQFDPNARWTASQAGRHVFWEMPDNLERLS